jgi:uncharacterized membrane protein
VTARLPDSAHGRLAWSIAGGIVIAVVVAALSHPMWGVLCGITATAATFVLTGWRALWPMDAESTSRHARRDEFEPRLEEVVVVGWALAGLIAVALLLTLGKTDERSLVALLALIGVAMSWAGLHLMYAARYAYLFYSDAPRGIDFNGDEPPAYRDFLYFSYNLGMTYQGVRHRRVESDDPRRRIPPLSPVIRLRHGHPGHHHQPDRQHRARLSPLSEGGMAPDDGAARVAAAG